MAEGTDNSWRTQSFRQNVRSKIEEAIRQSGNPTTKSVAEMENHVFQKAKTKEEYLGYVARLIIHVREMIDEDTDSDSSSTTSSEVEAYDTDEDEDYEGTPNGAIAGIGAQAQNNQGIQQMTPKGVKRKRSEMDNKDTSSQEINHLPSDKWNSQMNEWEAVGVNVYKKLQRMDPHQALYAESLITKVLRLGLLQSLTPESDVGLRPQYVQDFAPSVSSLCNSLENHAATPMYVNTHQSVGNSTFSNTVPLSTPFSAITTSSSGFETDHNAAVVDQSLTQNNLALSASNTVVEHHNSTQNNASSVIQSTVIAFKSDPPFIKSEPGLDESLS